MSLNFLASLAARRRFGMKPGLETISSVCAALGNPQNRFPAIHVAGTNGKGAVCAMMESCLRDGRRTMRYTSPHLVRLNERFFTDGNPVSDEVLDRLAAKVFRAIDGEASGSGRDVTFFEALTAVAFLLGAETPVDVAILECGLGGRLDATNVCSPIVSVITRIGLDHCDWLGDTVEKIAMEKAGIIKPGIPVILGRNEASVRRVIENRAREVGAPFAYAPDLVSPEDIPTDISLPGSFNRENAQTALAALKASGLHFDPKGLRNAVWPGRFQSVGRYLVDGAHNPPAAKALSEALGEKGGRVVLIAGFCGDKDIDRVLRILTPHVLRAFAVKTGNQRSLPPEDIAKKMAAAGMDAAPCASLSEARSRAERIAEENPGTRILICGSLFLAGEALVELGAYPWSSPRFDQSEILRAVVSPSPPC